MDISNSFKRGLEVGAATANLTYQVARHVGYTCFFQNIENVYVKLKAVEFLKMVVVRPLSFVLATNNFFNQSFLSAPLQGGIGDAIKVFKGCADSISLLTPAYKIVKLTREKPSSFTDGLSNFFFGVDRQSLNRDVFIRTLTAGVKFVQDFSSGFSFISPRLFGHFSLGQVSPRASKVVSWVTSDKVAFLAACVNAYLNLKGVSGDNLKEAVIALKETNFDPKTLGLQKQQLVVQVLGGMVFSSFAIMSLFKIFTERVSKNPALGFCNLVAFGTATGASLLQDRWRVAIDPKAV